MTTFSSRDSAADGVRRWVRRRPLTAFLLLTFGVGWPILAALARSRYGYGPGGGVILGRVVEEWLGIGLVALVLLPAALGVTAVAHGALGVRDLVRRAFAWRVGLAWGLLATVALPILAMALALAAGARWRDGAPSSLVASYVWSLASRTLLINLWEELAWAGFFQLRLQRRLGVVIAALATAVPFAAIHVPLLLTGETSVAPAFAGLVVLSAVFRLLVGVVLAGTRGSVLAAGVTHAAFNSTNNREGVLYAALAGADLSWQAPAAAALLAIPLVVGRAVVRHAAMRRLSRAGALPR